MRNGGYAFLDFIVWSHKDFRKISYHAEFLLDFYRLINFAWDTRIFKRKPEIRDF